MSEWLEAKHLSVTFPYHLSFSYFFAFKSHVLHQLPSRENSRVVITYHQLISSRFAFSFNKNIKEVLRNSIKVMWMPHINLYQDQNIRLHFVQKL